DARATTSTTKCRIFFDAAPPHEPRKNIGRNDPQKLDDQAAPQFRARRLAEINADGEIHLIRKRREKKNLFQHRRQNIERKQMAAGQIFKREQDEDEGGNFQEPERQHGHRVGDEKLQQRRQHQRNGKHQERGEIDGRQDVLPKTKNENHQRDAGHGDEGDASGKKY